MSREIENVYPLAPMQKGMLFHHLLDPQSNAYVIQQIFEIKGDLIVSHLESSWQMLMLRHAVFRSNFYSTLKEEPLQVVYRNKKMRVHHEDLRDLDESCREDALQSYVQQDKQQGFDLKKDMLLRVAIFQIENNVYRMVMSFHHIIMDGWCLSIMLEELIEIYKAIVYNKHPQLSPIVPYSNFIEWLQSSDQEEAARYWNLYLEGYEDQTLLPRIKQSTENEGYQLENMTFEINPSLTEQIKGIANTSHVTMSSFLQTVWGVLLHKINNTRDVVFGNVVSGRPSVIPGIERMVGLFINTVPVRITCEANQAFSDLLYVTQQQALASQAFETYPLYDIQAQTEQKQDLINHIFVFENYPLDQQLLNQHNDDRLLTITGVHTEEQTTYDFNMFVVPGDGIRIQFAYNSSVYYQESIERLRRQFIYLIEQIANNPQITMKDLRIVTPDEKNKLVNEFNAMVADYPRDQTIHSLFEEQVKRAPNNVAVCFEGKNLTYDELNKRANRLARTLIAAGVRNEQFVAIMAERSLEMVVGILAILKAGGVYVPIDPSYPDERIRYMLEDSGAKAIVLQGHLQVRIATDVLPVDRARSIFVILEDETSYDVDDSNIDNHVSSEHLAYVIYTSGTTGTPKGTMIAHKNVVRLFFTSEPLFDFKDTDVWTMFHSFCFDFSVWEMYGALLHGGKLVVVPNLTAKSPEAFLKLLQTEQVTILNQTPTYFYQLMQLDMKNSVVSTPLHLRMIIFGGEALTPSLLQSWKDKYPDIQLINMYGITETTVHVTYKEFHKDELQQGKSNIGKPIPTLQVYVLDEYRQLQPIGAAGEMYVAGPGLARGYLNKPELTAERFVSNPFVPGEKMYKSGDIARWLPDGNLEYVGRSDDQVKIRGYRIELAEIEAALLTLESMQEATVVAHSEQDGNKTLCAYYVANKLLTVKELKQSLSALLPTYMVPSYFVQMEEMPLTTNGKLDRKALPDPHTGLLVDSEYVAPRNEAERALVSIWETILGVSPIGIEESYFDLGGDSIKAIRLISAMNKQLNCNVSIGDLYRCLTISELNQLLNAATDTLVLDKQRKVQEIEMINEQYRLSEAGKTLFADMEDMYPMSDIQQGMVYYSMKHPELAIYHDQMTYELEDQHFDLDRLTKAMKLLSHKHESLRTSFFMDDTSAPIQIVHTNIVVEPRLSDLQHLNAEEQEHWIRTYLQEDRDHPFILQEAPLWRLNALQISRHKVVICWFFHHAIMDGWSVASFITELIQTYFQLQHSDDVKLTPLKCSNKDFVIEQLVLSEQTDMAQYWKEELQDYKRLQLPFVPQKQVQTEANVVTLELGTEWLNRLQQVAHTERTTLKTVCFSAYLVMMSMLSYDQDITVGLIENNRPLLEDGEQILGCFLNSVPFRMNITEHESYVSLLRKVRDKHTELKTYGRYPLRKIVEAVEGAAPSGQNPFFDVIFNYVDFHVYEKLEQTALQFGKLGYERTNTLFNFNLSVTFDRLIINVVSILPEQEIKKVMTYYQRIMEQMVQHKHSRIHKQRLMTEEEQNQLFHMDTRLTADYPSTTIHRLFEEQVERTPEKIAVSLEGSNLTYDELNKRANRLARTLIANGVHTEQFVGIMAKRSLEMVIGILAILKAGGVYVPIDPDYPDERIRYMLEDSGVKALVIQSHLQEQITNLEVLEGTDSLRCVYLDNEAAYDADDSNVDILVRPDHLAYIIYTSGTTGEPKGTMIAHKNIVRLFFTSEPLFEFKDTDVWTMFHSFCFDFSVWEMYGALLHGGRLVIVPNVTAKSPEAFLQLLRVEQVTILNQTPTYFYQLMQLEMNNQEIQPLKLNTIIFGGEELNPSLLRRWKDKYPHIQFINMYGITETTVHVTYKELTDDVMSHSVSNIGRPIPTLQVYVLDEHRQPQPIGITGEMYIAGAGLARGYWNKSELTAARFVDNPFMPGKKMYKSGDMARRLPDGNLEYVGRIDHQVKIRGYRIELGEIETALLRMDAIHKAVILAHESKDGTKSLSAYYAANHQVPVGELKRALSSYLPAYMLPSYFVQIEEMPLTSNGKLDRQALPDPQTGLFAGSEYVAPRNETERVLVSIWETILEASPIGMEDSYFDLGGDSIKAIRLISAMNKKLDWNVSIGDLYRCPTITELNQLLNTDTDLLVLDKQRIVQEIEMINQQFQLSEVGETKFANMEDMYPMSDIQQGMVYYSMKHPELAIYHNQLTYELEDERFDLDRLTRAMKMLTDKHEILRTSFHIDAFSSPVQVVHANSNVEPRLFDLQHLNSEAQGEWLTAYLQDDRNHPFVLQEAPLWRLNVLQVSSNKVVICWFFHHAIMDGWSVASFITELIQTYFQLQYSDDVKLSPLKCSNKDFVIEQLFLSEQSDMAQYWKEELQDYKHLQLPFDPQKHMRSETNVVTLELDSEWLNRLQQVAQSERSTLKTVCFTAYLVMMNMLSYDQDITVGLIENNRPLLEDGEQILGCFLNSVPFRMNISQQETYVSLLRKVRDKHTELKTYGRYPLRKIVEAVEGVTPSKGNPLFDVIFNYVDFHVYERLETTQLQSGKEGHERTNTFFNFNLSVTFEQLLISVGSVLPESEMKRLLSYYQQIIEELVQNKHAQINKSKLMAHNEQDHWMLRNINEPFAEYPHDKTLHTIFEDQVMRTPDHIAVSYEDQALTYDQLNKRANQLARTLKAKGVDTERFVAIMAERSLEMVVGILAILKAGGVYVPIDPDYPEERIRYMLEDSGAEVIVLQDHLQSRIANIPGFAGMDSLSIVTLDERSSYDEDDSNLDNDVSSEHLAYVIYTSGTTGKPKGTMIEHKNVVRLFFNSEPLFDFNDTDVWPLFHSFCFDVSVWEMYGALLHGGRLVVVPSMTAKSPPMFMELLLAERVTILNQTPTYFYQLMRVKSGDCTANSLKLRKIIFAGEALNPAMLQDWKAKYPTTQLINMYGITETTVHATYKALTEDDLAQDTSNIGRPIPTLQMYVLDKHHQLQPVGVVGELYVAGAGLARGYLNKPELTDERFVDHPFAPGEKLYKSGDFARWMPDGNLEYLGRIDHQVKIRGYRIELAEVEAALLKVEGVQETVVIPHEPESGVKVLCAYYVAGEQLNVDEVRAALAQQLPSYMLPSYWVRVESIPLTPNGKRNIKALPLPEMSLQLGNVYMEPRNEIEKQLALIWQEVLGIERVSVTDNFFTIGGHSLRATTLVAKIQKAMNVRVSLRDVFECATIEQLAAIISETQADDLPLQLSNDGYEAMGGATAYLGIEKTYDLIPVTSEHVSYPVSSAQKRIYFLSQLEGGELSYNMPIAMIVEGTLDVGQLQQALEQMMERHEALRTSFYIEDGEIRQRISSHVPCTIHYKQLCEAELRAYAAQFMQPFNLAAAPLLRVELIRIQDLESPAEMEAERHLLLMDVHHLISDGVSQSIFMKEWFDLYEGKELQLLRIQYKDYAVWQQSELGSSELNKQEDYWLSVFNDSIPVLNMPIDYARPMQQQFNGKQIHFAISKIELDGLKHLAEQTETTLYMVLLAIYTTLLSKYTGQEDIVVGSPVAGRSHFDVEPLLGVFVNTLAMRNQPTANKTFIEFLQEVKEHAIDAYDHQDYPFEELVDKVNAYRDRSRNPLFDTMFALQNMDRHPLHQAGLTIQHYQSDYNTAKVDFMLWAAEVEEQLQCTLEYATSLFAEETMQRMTSHFIHLLKAVLRNPQAKLSTLEWVTEEEKVQIIEDFNNTDYPYACDKTIHQRFEEQVQRTPEQIAVVFDNVEMTYQQLNERADGVARMLMDMGVHAEQFVGIMAERSLDMIVGMLGIMKAGGAYVPIDPDYPEERISYMLHDSEIKVLLLQQHLQDRIHFHGELLVLDDPRNASIKREHVESVNNANHNMYVIYTSGSTGKPKGVTVKHQAVHNLLHSLYSAMPFQKCTSMLSMASFSFDMFILESFLPLTHGLKLVLADPKSLSDAQHLHQLVHRQAVDIMQSTPSRFKTLLDQEEHRELFRSVRMILMGGEEMPAGLVEQLHSVTDAAIFNMYGPTETTVWSSFSEIKGSQLHIGKPIANTQMYVVNEHLQLQPIGVSGELCIGGAGVSSGYLNRPDLTEKKFIDSPYRLGEKLYRTGDLAKWLPDGNLEYIGRTDHQVKIRGYRIELGEIEAALLKVDSIQSVSVGTYDMADGNKALCAYFVANKPLVVRELKQELSEMIPAYMLPSYWVQLSDLPLNSNGKLDRKALPTPNEKLYTGSEYVAARNELEKQLVTIWEAVLDVSPIGVEDHYFDIGGDSIRAIRMISAMNKQLNGNVRIGDLYRYPTIAELSQQLTSGTTVLVLDKQQKQQELESLKQQLLMSESGIALSTNLMDMYPMSDIQQGMVYYAMKYPQMALYHDQMTYELQDVHFDGERFAHAMQLLVEKHEILRTSFHMEKFPIPMQVVHEPSVVEPNHIDLQHLNPVDQEAWIKRLLQKDRDCPFVLHEAPLWRLHLLQTSKDKVLITWIFHHAIMDGWSVASFITELIQTYYELKEGDVQLSLLKSSYKDFVIEQLAVSEQIEMARYWSGELEGYKHLQLPSFQQKHDQSEANSVTLELDSKWLLGLQQVAQTERTSLKSVCLTAYMAMMSMLCYEQDLTIGLIENNRPLLEDGEQVLGCFLNSVPFRMNIAEHETWATLLRKVHDKHIELKSYGRYPLHKIVAAAGEGASFKENPFFDVIFNYVDFHVYEKLEDTPLQIGKFGYERTNTLLNFSLSISLDRLAVNIVSILPELEIRKLMAYYERIVEEMVRDLHSNISKRKLMAQTEEDYLLRAMNEPAADYPRDQTIHRLFEEQVKRTPDKAAVSMGGSELTYNELNKRANRLARTLKTKGVGTEQFVAIMAERSLEMVVGILAILKAGGTYVPIDPDYPDERIRYMLEDSGAKVLLLQNHLLEQMEMNEMSTVMNRTTYILLDDEDSYEIDDSNVDSAMQANHLAYVIYTSGTTGKPKGTMIEHKNIVRLFFNSEPLFDFKETDIWTLFHSFCFDFSVWEMYGALLYGGKLIIVPSLIAKSPPAFMQLLCAEQVTILNQTPTYFNQLMQVDLDKHSTEPLWLRTIIFGGEALNPSLLQPWKVKYPDIQLINMYGITETTVHVTYKELGAIEMEQGASNIGKPIPTLQVYVLDERQQLQPVGAVGELYVAGDGLARGYLNQPSLTAERFVDNPFRVGEKMYKTGDLVSWLPDGNLEYKGRIDHQVKIRGYRIELAEVEAALLDQDGVQEVIIKAIEQGDDTKALCAYFVANELLLVDELRVGLAQSLPAYMMPSYWVQLDAIPLTPQGKRDLKALPNPVNDSGTCEHHVVPRNATEEQLVLIWQEVLGMQHISVTDNFFDIGGHSLRATALVIKIHKAMNIRVPLRDVFEYTTIERMADLIDCLQTTQQQESDSNHTCNGLADNAGLMMQVQAYEPIPVAPELTYYPVSSAQKRMYIIHQLEGHSLTYNMPVVMRIEGELDIQRAEMVFHQLVERHESLRTSFVLEAGDPVQLVHPITNFGVDVIQAREEEVRDLIRDFVKPFDLTKSPLLRVGLIELMPEPKLNSNSNSMYLDSRKPSCILLIDMHHIISDGESIKILMKEFVQLYAGECLPSLKLQYKDYAVWQQAEVQAERMKEQENYWLSALEGELPLLDLPLDYDRPTIRSYEGEGYRFTIDPLLREKLESLASETGTTLYMVLWAAYSVLLGKYSGQSDIIIGLPIAGRTHTDIEQLVGMFVNTLAIRNAPKQDKTFHSFLVEVRENMLSAYENQDYPFDELIEKVNYIQQSNRHPIIDTLFNMTHLEQTSMQTESFTCTPYETNQVIAKFDLVLNVLEANEELLGNFEYASRLFKRSMIESLTNDFLLILGMISDNPDIKLQHIQLQGNKSAAVHAVRTIELNL